MKEFLGNYRGLTENPSRIYGYDNDRLVDGVTFKNLRINGEVATNQEEANFITNEFTKNIKFIIEPREVESLKS